MLNSKKENTSEIYQETEVDFNAGDYETKQVFYTSKDGTKVPMFIVHKKGLVKTEGFKESKYVGDPINAVKIFNEKEVDELIVLDIDATVENRGPNFEMIKNIAVECRMPFCYGGGVSSVEEAKKIVQLGAEKVAFSAAAINKPMLLDEVGEVIGRQSVVVVLDYKKKGLFDKLEIFSRDLKPSTP